MLWTVVVLLIVARSRGVGGRGVECERNMQRYVLDGGDTRRGDIQAVRQEIVFSRTRYRQAGRKESGDEKPECDNCKTVRWFPFAHVGQDTGGGR
eukprot:7310502-Prymnesium_polylepis.1